MTRNENFPLVAWPSDAAVRQTTEYAPDPSGRVMESETPFSAMLDGCPSGIGAPAASRSWIDVKRSSGFSENQSESDVGATVSESLAAGLLRTRRAWANNSAGVARMAAAAMASAAG